MIVIGRLSAIYILFRNHKYPIYYTNIIYSTETKKIQFTIIKTIDMRFHIAIKHKNQNSKFRVGYRVIEFVWIKFDG